MFAPIVSFLDGVVAPLRFFAEPGKRIHVLYLAAALLIALSIYLLRRRDRGFSGRGLAGALRFLFPGRIWRHPSSRLDLKLLVVNAWVRLLLLLPLTLPAMAVILSVHRGLRQAFGDPVVSAASPLAVAMLYTVALFVIDDLSRYLLHRLLHRVPALWELHKVHHSAEVLTPLTLYRVHPLESLLYGLRGALAVGASTGVFVYLFGPAVDQVTILGINGFGFVFSLLGANLRHSHVWITYGRIVERIFISPAQHQVHHSAEAAHADRNFGTALALWDWLGGSLALAGKRGERPRHFGLAPSEQNHGAGLLSAYVRPMVAALRRLLPWRRAAAAVAGGLLLAWASVAAAQGAPASKPAQPVEPVFFDPSSGSVGVTPGKAKAKDHGKPSAIKPKSKGKPSKAASASSKRTKDRRWWLAPVSIFGRRSDRARIAGSAHAVSEKDLERHEYDDIHRVLQKVPGVYVRTEDGFGLRPNIGLRGANSDRSAKVTLMEDGVLLAPAPYSAPAAYYFPLLTRLVGVEVFKGPASVRFGPNTIGGALNLETRVIPQRLDGAVDVAAGLYGYAKTHGHVGYRGKRWGLLLEGVRLSSTGFKELPSGDDTGFEKRELMAKTRYHGDPNAALYYQLDLKLGYADESSRETYLGLTDADFAQNSLQRYAASDRGLMEWWRTQAVARAFIAYKDLDVSLTAYRNDFSRDWRKLNGIAGASISDVLSDPTGANAVLLAVLAGRQDSSTAQEVLKVGTNSRRFVSQGVSLRAHLRLPKLWKIRQDLEVGLRLHHDYIERDHDEGDVVMRSGVMVPSGDASVTTDNRGETVAFAAHVHDEIRVGGLLVSPGLRVEVIRRSFEDRQPQSAPGLATGHDTDVVLIPGIGAYYQIQPWLGVLAGVHRGFSPVAPGQIAAVKPESSTNYEAGFRFAFANIGLRGELIGFVNDYENLTVQCTISSGCTDAQLALQFDAPAVLVYGLESSLSEQIRGPWGSTLWADLAYTLTLSRFRESFRSGFSQFGDVEEGDELPYVPNHQLAVRLGIASRHFGFSASLSLLSAMRDVAGQGDIVEAEKIPMRGVVDLAAFVALSSRARVYATVNNLFDHRYIASRRPFGARPGQPLMVRLGFKYRFGASSRAMGHGTSTSRPATGGPNVQR